ncbi:hypothetical protein FNF28_03548 [Cafeteria roenbergensis]|uniref:HhH-GPD domain-containing protein n=1 Tax=Cafeteria roenbergensis TaxID=33653 RepID=A0A5A8DJ41_CAFRO|nr:hypothetical protein FNF28_03548 [Cafeteria roenbergensis]
MVSPMKMFQETYGYDPWKLLSGCVLSSRTSGGDRVWGPIRAFFERFPTPTAVLDEAEANGLAGMEEMLKPLGLNRERTITRAAEGFLRVWDRPSELYGCGKFAEDSWLAFCHGEVRRVAKDPRADRNVRAFTIVTDITVAVIDITVLLILILLIVIFIVVVVACAAGAVHL